MSCITQWCSFFCYTQECDGGAVGFVGNLGVCKCKVNSTDDICDMQCRSNQRRRIELDCSDPPRLIINPVEGEVSHTIHEFNLFLPLSSPRGLSPGTPVFLCLRVSRMVHLMRFRETITVGSSEICI